LRKEKEIFTFRRYKKKEGKKQVRHPKLIVDDYSNSFGYMGLTENKKNGHHRNIPLKQNPKKDDNRAAYLRKDIRYDKKTRFGQILDSYKLSKEDKQYIIEYVNKHKKR
jgi:hypothetical protein